MKPLWRFAPKQPSELAFGVEPANRRYRLRLARYDYLGRRLRSDSRGGGLILDLACGKGRLALHYARGRGCLLGLDSSSARLRRASGRGYACLFYADLLDGLPFAGNVFDTIVCEQLLEHFDDRHVRFVLAEIVRTLKPGGTAYIGTPVYTRPVLWLVRLREALPRGVRDRVFSVSTHRQHRTLAEWKQAIGSSGLVISSARGFRLFSLPRNWLEDHKWYWGLQGWVGRHAPSLCIEANVCCYKPGPQ